MKKIQCPEIKKGENVHKHYCWCCRGKQHIPAIQALKYELGGLCVLDFYSSTDASDYEMHRRINEYIEYHRKKYEYDTLFTFDPIFKGEPIATLNACIETIKKK